MLMEGWLGRRFGWCMVILSGVMWKRLMLRILTVFCGNESVDWFARRNVSLKRKVGFVVP